MKRVGFDLDGVLYDLYPYMTELAGYPKEIGRYKFFKEWGWTHEEFLEFIGDKILNHNLYNKVPIDPVAKRTLELLSKMGYYIVICTVRGVGMAADVEAAAQQQTKDWLKTNKVKYDELIFTDDKTNANCFSFFDDYIRHYNSLEQSQRCVPWLYRQPYNDRFKARRIFSFADVPGAVIWSENHINSNVFSA